MQLDRLCFVKVFKLYVCIPQGGLGSSKGPVKAYPLKMHFYDIKEEDAKTVNTLRPCY